MITPKERVAEYESRISKLEKRAIKCAEYHDYDAAISALIEARSLREAQTTIYILTGEGWIKENTPA